MSRETKHKLEQERDENNRAGLGLLVVLMLGVVALVAVLAVLR